MRSLAKKTRPKPEVTQQLPINNTAPKGKNLRSEITRLERDLREQKNNVAERFRELAILAKMLVERDQNVKRMQNERQELESRVAQLENELRHERDRHKFAAQVYEAKFDRTHKRLSWQITAPFRRVAEMVRGRQSHIRRVIEGSGLFDRNWYLANYQDVAEAGLDPLDHYLRFGAREGRDPSPAFSTTAYLQNNPDVLEGGHNPLVHFVCYGYAEGRWW